MHHALELHEILLTIFGHCYPPGTQRTLSDLAALARTCRAFKEPALDVLWEDLDDLYPLVRCLPEASHRLFPDKHPFGRPLTTAQWDILRSYTRRVRFVQNIGTGLDQKSLRTLLNPPTTDPLFPNLRHLCCKFATEAIPLSHLSLPCLVSIDLKFKSARKFQDYLKSFPESLRDIRKLGLYVYGQLEFMPEFGSSYLCQWRNLQTVICHQIALNLDAFVHLSRMPALTRLTCMVSDTLPASDSPLCFSNLRHLTLQGPFTLTSRLLFQIRLPVVTDLAAYIANCPSRRDLSSFLISAQTSTTPHTIETLWLTQAWFWTTGRNQDVPMLGLDDLQLCIAFCNLRCLHVNIEWDVGLTDSDLCALALAWPHLEKLSINTDWGWNTLEGITPNGLLQLLQICRSLKEVALAIDTRDYTEFPSSLENPGLTLPPTFFIDVLDSIIKEESVLAVAAFFASIAPRPGFSFGYWNSLEMLQSSSESWKVYRERWMSVSRLVKEAVSRRS